MANKVIARYLDGRVLKGSSLDVSPNRPICHLREGEGAMTQVRLDELKALFFVKSLDGDPKHVEGQEIEPVDPRLRGSHLVDVTFGDGEKIRGLCTRYPPQTTYFFLVPVDSTSNNVRILVNGAAMQGVAPAEVSDGQE
ncbi:MAG: hypothetical protein IPF98_02655 [Gemmatimonadetes bacterium]|nr:hypothetical protein [Gemmatimonadota bacterium]MCC6771342.1 hypothetical protein [Gemmatimonadaceae bacterium]